MPAKRNLFSEISEEVGDSLFGRSKEASRSTAVPFGQKVPTNARERTQVQRQRMMADPQLARDTFHNDRAKWREMWEET